MKRDFELRRCVRFCVSPHAQEPPTERVSTRLNGFAGVPRMAGIGTYYELEIACKGLPDPATGYLLNIAEIDRAVRDHAIEIVDAAMRSDRQPPASKVLAAILSAIQPPLGNRVSRVTWNLTPYYGLSVHTASPDRVLMTQQFEFAAAHRLHRPDLSAEQNRTIFGKCNNPNGHGHNYRLEVSVATQIEPEQFDLATLETIVQQQVIERFDHKNLNVETEEFRTLNPSVEHIAKVCHDLLLAPLRGAGAELTRVTVWETQKTSCTYPA